MATDFGARVKMLRERAGLSVSRLAQKSAVTQGYLSQIETGKRPNPGALTLVALATALRISLDELMDYDPNALPPEPSGGEGERLSRLEALVHDLARTVAESNRIAAQASQPGSQRTPQAKGASAKRKLLGRKRR